MSKRTVVALKITFLLLVLTAVGAVGAVAMGPSLQVVYCPIHPEVSGIFTRYDNIGGKQVKVYRCYRGPHEFVVPAF